MSDNGLTSRDPDTILALLRRTALKTQRDHVQPFYSIRAVAEQFQIPRAMVSRIYRHLSEERLLRSIWGSRTLLEPTKSAKKKNIGTIGIAVDLVRFRSSSEYCDAVLKLQNAVLQHGVTERLIFLRDVNDVPRLLRQQHSREIRGIVRLFPEASDGNALLRLRDMGVRVICIGGAPVSGIRHCYSKSRRGGFGKIVREHILKII